MPTRRSSHQSAPRISGGVLSSVISMGPGGIASVAG